MMSATDNHIVKRSSQASRMAGIAGIIILIALAAAPL